MSLARIGMVVVFKANGPNIDTGNFRCGVAAVDRFWCLSCRKTSLKSKPDYVGIYVQAEHEFFSGFFGSGRNLNETIIVRLEPSEN